MELGNGNRVAVVGGGPAGSFCAFFLRSFARQTGLELEVEIYEPRDFSQTGPIGCNMCGGVISESLVQSLATDGIPLRPPVILHTLDSYALHTESGSVEIPPPIREKRIACIFRGGGPKGAESQCPLPWESFDRHLLQHALAQGARRIAHRVSGIDRDPEGRPRLHVRGHPPRTCDLLVGALGLNSPAIHLFEQLGFGYRTPRHTRAYLAELYYGEEDVDRLLGHAMHIFLLNIPRLEFAALVPKGHYATFIILGHEVDQELVSRVLAAPQVHRLFPLGWELAVTPCQCQPRIQVGDPEQPYGDRVVMVGDATVSRLYKDGIGAAYRTAKAAAMTAVFHGVDAASFQRHYWPVCHELSRDNRLGHMVFNTVSLFQRFRFLRLGLLDAVTRERGLDGTRPLSSALWDTFTGSAPYREILLRSLRPDALARLALGSLKGLLPSHPSRGTRP